MYTHVTIRLQYGQMGAFAQTMPKVQAIVEQIGWTLLHALAQTNGQLFTVFHIWKLRDMNHYAEGIAHLTAHPDFAALTAELGQSVMTEEITFCAALPYSPG